MTNSELEWWATELLILLIAAIIFINLLPQLAP